MGATLSELRARLRIRLDEATAVYWSDAALMDFLNEGCREIARRALYLESVSTWANTAGAHVFDPSDTLLDNCLKVNRLEWTPTGTDLKYVLDYRPYQNMDSIWWTSQDITTSIPQYFMMWGVGNDLNLQVYPKCASTGDFNLFYWRYPVAMEANDDDSEIPIGWEDLAVTFAEYLARLRDRDDRWQQAFRKFDSDIGLMMSMANSHSIHGQSFTTQGYMLGNEWLYDGGW